MTPNQSPVRCAYLNPGSHFDAEAELQVLVHDKCAERSITRHGTEFKSGVVKGIRSAVSPQAEPGEVAAKSMLERGPLSVDGERMEKGFNVAAGWGGGEPGP